MENTPKGYKSICLPFASESEYEEIVKETKAFRSYLNKQIEQYPELFPPEIREGFNFCGFVTSKKQQSTIRRIKLANQEVYQVRPSFLLPYMSGKTDVIEKALYLRRWGVPFEALAYVFGHNAMYWYRIYTSLGRPSIVGTTVKDPDKLPLDLLADEKHTWILGERVYAATTVGAGCLLGVGLSESAGADDLKAAYQEFQQEAKTLKADYQPATVNTDGWLPTQQAWLKLFPTITIIACFLHAWLKIQDRAKSLKELLPDLKARVWFTYHSNTKAQFAQRIRRLREWSLANISNSIVISKVLELCSLSARFQRALDFPNAHRTSAHLDRLMNYQDRILYAAQYFHGTDKSARLYLRAMALLWNFHPFGSKTTKANPNRISPFADLNGFVYHHNWLHNLFIASSLHGYPKKHKKR